MSAVPAPPAAAAEIGLVDLPLRQVARIVSMRLPDGGGQPDLVERLAELGFLPGEQVRVIARALFGEPLAVRVGNGTFALRRLEAACVRVVPLLRHDAGA